MIQVAGQHAPKKLTRLLLIMKKDDGTIMGIFLQFLQGLFGGHAR